MTMEEEEEDEYNVLIIAAYYETGYTESKTRESNR